MDAQSAAAIAKSGLPFGKWWYSDPLGAFATWLSQTQGLVRLTCDYRDFGASAIRRLV